MAESRERAWISDNAIPLFWACVVFMKEIRALIERRCCLDVASVGRKAQADSSLDMMGLR